MKKVKLIGASIFLIFCLVFYNYPTVDSVFCTNTENEHGDLVVIKEVYYDGDWTEGPIQPDIGDKLQFRITLTYYNTSNVPKLHWAFNIRVNDTLPECLDYEVGSADPKTNFLWNDDPNESLKWYLGEQILFDEESFVIKYNATVVSSTGPSGENNTVKVLWDERCTYNTNIDSTDLLLLVIGLEPDINLIKKVWDPIQHQYVKSINAYENQIIQFRIDIINTGQMDLTNVIVNDTYPDFLTPLNYSLSPILVNPIDTYIIWNIGTLNSGDNYVLLFNASVGSVSQKTTSKNIANVTCDQDLTDEDNVTIILEKHLLVDKKVKHPETGEWVEKIPYVRGCEPVRFKINITYHGIDRMKCLLVYDQLPYQCLEYADNLYIEIAGQVITEADEDYYPEIFLEDDNFIMCGNPVEIIQGGVYFSWINQSLGSAGAVEDGDSVIIEFDASVVDYCGFIGDDICCEMQNCVEAWLWSCCDTVFYAMDCVNITCVALPGEFNKTVSLEEPTNWGKEVQTVQGNVIKFKLNLIYYGNKNLTNVSFYDVLPCCLEYKDTLESPAGTIVEVSSDKKYIWWNVSRNVSDCEAVSIIFRADVTGSSECGGCINYAYVNGYVKEFEGSYKLVVDRMDNASIYAEANSPPQTPDVSGPYEGIVGVQYSFKTMLQDIDGDQISYKFDWGDGITDWLGPVSSGEVIETHTYSSSGTYFIKAKARDEHGAESEWTKYPWEITIKVASIEVTFETFNIGNVEAVVENTGDADLTNIAWEFNISRDSLLNFRDINVNGNGAISNLAQGQSETISSDSVGLRIGMADVEAMVTKTGVIEPTSATGTAFIIGPLILIF